MYQSVFGYKIMSQIQRDLIFDDQVRSKNISQKSNQKVLYVFVRYVFLYLLCADQQRCFFLLSKKLVHFPHGDGE